MKITEYHPFKSAEAKKAYLTMYDARAKKYPVPSETKIVETSYGKTFVRISGPADAPPLVLLTGLGGNSLDWTTTIGELSRRYRAYAVDNINDMGLSVATRPINGPDDFTAWLDEVFASLRLEDHISMLGVSYGGWLAGEYALRHPGRLHKIVMLMAGAMVRPISPEFNAMAAQMATGGDAVNRFVQWLYEDFLRQDEANRKKLEAVFAEQMIAASYFEPKQAIAPRVFSDEELQGIKVPVLFLIGENERIVSAREAVARLNRVAPQIKTEIIRNAGHNVILTHKDMVTEKALEFLGAPLAGD